jgi:hypothetical protein
MIEPQNTGITIEGDLVPMIQRGEAVNLGLLVYDVENAKLTLIGFFPDTAGELGALLAKFGIVSEEVK